MSIQTVLQTPADSRPSIAVVLVNLGTPDAPTPVAVRRYLKEFLSDRRVVDIPRWIWWFILNVFILPFRARKSARKYASIWSKDGSPLRVHTQKQAKLLRGYLGERKHDVQVVCAMRYGSPSLPEVLESLKQEGCERVLILPAYPQYCIATTASVFDAVTSYYTAQKNIPELRFIKSYNDHEAYVGALTESVLAHWEANGRSEKLVMSFHGMPKKTQEQGDPYHDECQMTARLLAERLGLTSEEYIVTFQSRFGAQEWLQPYTAPTLEKLARSGLQQVDVICPGFIADCLETLEEIAIEGRQEFLTAGGKDFHYIPCLNESNTWMHALAEIAEQHLLGWPTMMSAAVQEEQREQARLLQATARLLGSAK